MVSRRFSATRRRLSRSYSSVMRYPISMVKATWVTRSRISFGRGSLSKMYGVRMKGVDVTSVMMIATTPARTPITTLA